MKHNLENMIKNINELKEFYTVHELEEYYDFVQRHNYQCFNAWNYLYNSTIEEFKLNENFKPNIYDYMGSYNLMIKAGIPYDHKTIEK